MKYTFAYLCFPQVKPNYEITTWCPRAIRDKEHRTFGMYDGRPSLLHEVLNTENYFGSLKDAYFEGRSMDKQRSDDRLLMRARKPYYKRMDKSMSLNFGGRVKKSSRKNI